MKEKMYNGLPGKGLNDKIIVKKSVSGKYGVSSIAISKMNRGGGVDRPPTNCMNCMTSARCSLCSHSGLCASCGGATTIDFEEVIL